MVMTAAPLDRPQANAPAERNAAFAGLILLRAAAGPTTRAELVRDLRPLTASEPSLAALGAAAYRARAEAEIEALVSAGLATEQRGRLKATPAGEAEAARTFGLGGGPLGTWSDLRCGPLCALALGLPPSDRAVLKALANADALRALVLQRAYGVSDGRSGSAKPMSLSKLRAALAVRALERAFGNQIKGGLGSGTGLGPKASRLLAAQLSKNPRDHSSDGRLIAALAAEDLATPNAEADVLRSALLARAFKERFDAAAMARRSQVQQDRTIARVPAAPSVSAAAPPPGKPSPLAARPANDPGAAGKVPLPSARPDLAGFVKAVQQAAARRADGWPGNRKAFICHVWQEIKSGFPAWGVSEIEFKGMLAEAHRTGGLVLATADLKDKKYIQEFELSAIQFKNTVWHFVRVDES